ncbi:Vancomycin resistance protein YoaR, contains peptidoglycan-binding and VanW domains [Amycolatopsis marina]|uniref:Vancomycin resistance protein YoaR, contains peptidoglycan-binding and VanW domains n=1 Tax=Amycolatopsis marina TaxID=490629 RepID=A0A1I0YN52_9PSEU|nr:VanW family protein [Amycolatopsis marina]SFB14829.1 Vancomycin resistance protein YoaR, contains peptidoglycan-binding and VanW domains [Amycolatopsis marina]
MPQDHQWPESHADQTDVLPALPGSHDGPTDQHPLPKQPGEPAGESSNTTNRWRKPALIGGAVVGVLALLYGIDLLVSQGSVPRGVTVAGVEVGGMSQSDAEQTLREQIEPRLEQPVQIAAGDVQETVDPRSAGLAMNWRSTLDQAGDQPLNPITRLTSFFTSTEVGVVTQAEPNQLQNAMNDLQKKVDRKPVEGSVKFEGAKPVAVEPKQGQQLDVDAAKQVVLAQWASGQALELPVTVTPVTITSDAVQVAMKQVAEPAVSAPVVVHGEGKDATLEPEEIAKGLSFEPGDGGSLKPKIDQKKIVEGLSEELKSTEKEGKDATIEFEGGKPTVHPSVEGNQVKWDKTLAPLLEVLKREDKRELTAEYEKKPAEVTTEEAEKLGINEVIGEFTTGGFAPDSGVNIRVVAEEVNGAIVKPGETFSLNGHTGPRGTAQGYVPAGIIENGAPGKAVGGGISQFATTLYNASYFAGMKDAGHKEHSYYISRYPAAREATVFQSTEGASIIDLKFTNDAETGVAIQTIWSPSSITVRLWGTKRYEVESIPGGKSNFVDPPTEPGPDENCKPSNGAPGFTTSDTRVLKDASSGAVVRKEPRTVKYNPQPKITCDSD